LTAVPVVLSNKKLTKVKKIKVLTLKKDFSVPLCLCGYKDEFQSRHPGKKVIIPPREGLKFSYGKALKA